MKFKLSEIHPTVVRLHKVFRLMEELGISLDVGAATTTVRDTAYPERVFVLEDIDKAGDICNVVTEFPCPMETRLTFETEDKA